MNVYSNAFNFSSYLNGSVDPRTGQYGAQINLAQLSPEGPLEVSRSIVLLFSMFEPGRVPYGLGWRLSNTEFDLSSAQLTLISGERFKTQGMPSVGGMMVFKDRKLKDLVVRRTNETTLHVIYRDGTIEVLERTSSTLPYRITSIRFENGEVFRFGYAPGGSLERILNHKQEELLLLTYASGRLQTADRRVEGGGVMRVRDLHRSMIALQVSLRLTIVVVRRGLLPIRLYTGRRFVMAWLRLSGCKRRWAELSRSTIPRTVINMATTNSSPVCPVGRRLQVPINLQ